MGVSKHRFRVPLPPPMQVVNRSLEPLPSPQLLESGELVKDSMKGLFVSREELNDYERLWHCHVYQPTWNQLQEKVSLDLIMEYSDC